MEAVIHPALWLSELSSNFLWNIIWTVPCAWQVLLKRGRARIKRAQMQMNSSVWVCHEGQSARQCVCVCICAHTSQGWKWYFRKVECSLDERDQEERLRGQDAWRIACLFPFPYYWSGNYPSIKGIVWLRPMERQYFFCRQDFQGTGRRWEAAWWGHPSVNLGVGAKCSKGGRIAKGKKARFWHYSWAGLCYWDGSGIFHANNRWQL